jgi:hypothetical protein
MPSFFWVSQRCARAVLILWAVCKAWLEYVTCFLIDLEYVFSKDGTSYGEDSSSKRRLIAAALCMMSKTVRAETAAAELAPLSELLRSCADVGQVSTGENLDGSLLDALRLAQLS